MAWSYFFSLEGKVNAKHTAHVLWVHLYSKMKHWCADWSDDNVPILILQSPQLNSMEHMGWTNTLKGVGQQHQQQKNTFRNVCWNSSVLLLSLSRCVEVIAKVHWGFCSSSTRSPNTLLSHFMLVFDLSFYICVKMSITGCEPEVTKWTEMGLIEYNKVWTKLCCSAH